MLRKLGGTVVAFGLTAFGAFASEPKVIPAQVGIAQKSSSWKDQKAGLVVARNSEEYLRALKVVYGENLPRIDPQPFDDRMVYLYVFAGQTTAGGGHTIEAVRVEHGESQLTVKCRIIEPAGGQVGIAVVRSPWLLVKIKKDDIPIRQASERTVFRLNAERLRHIRTDDQPATVLP